MVKRFIVEAGELIKVRYNCITHFNSSGSKAIIVESSLMFFIVECKRHEPGNCAYPGGPVRFPELMCDPQLPCDRVIPPLFQNLSCLASRSTIYHLFKCFLCRISIKSGKTGVL